MRLRDWRPLPLITGFQATFVPFINVMWLLVGFLALSPAFLTLTGVPIQLPKAVMAEAVGGAGIVITVTESRLIYLHGQLIRLEELSDQLKVLVAAQQGPTVLIKADHRVPMETVAQIWDVCRRLGVARIAMATTRTPP